MALVARLLRDGVYFSECPRFYRSSWDVAAGRSLNNRLSISTSNRTVTSWHSQKKAAAASNP